MPRLSRRLKVGILGVIASLVIALSLHAEESKVMCYVIAQMPEVDITDVEVSPTPTAGADSVTVKALAAVVEPELDSNYISAAYLRFYEGDTTHHPLFPTDSVFDESSEELAGRLDVSGLQPGTTWVYLNVRTTRRGLEGRDIPVWVTEGNKVIEDDTDPCPPEQSFHSHEE